MPRRLRILLALAAALLTPIVFAAPAHAGSAHFVGTPQAVRDGDTLTVTGKIAGLGDEPQVHVVLTAVAECVNPGGHQPPADNKQTVSAAADVPVMNGKALFELAATAAFQPSCSPPMSVVFSEVTVTDTTSGISVSLDGTF